MCSPCSPVPRAVSLQSFGIAVAFLSCLQVPGVKTGGLLRAESIAASVLWYPLVGLLMGVLCTAPAYALSLLPPTGHLSWVWAWCYVVAGFLLTRGLHWDGLADITDAWGSGAQGPRFWEIVKDSRLGAFGAMGQLIVFSGLVIVAEAHTNDGHWLALIMAPCVGRAACLFLAASTPPRTAHSLGGMACAGATPRCAWGWGIVLFLGLLLLWGFAVTLMLALALALLLIPLHRLARRHGGCNGDFLGTAILLAEWSTLAVVLLK